MIILRIPLNYTESDCSGIMPPHDYS